MKVKLDKVCKRIYAGGDVPKDRYSTVMTSEYTVPIYANAEKDDGLYGYTDTARENELSITVAARGTIGFTAIRRKPFLPVVRLITVVPDLSKVSERYLYYALKNCKPASSGTSIPQLTVPDIKKNEIELYSLPVQEKIADKLDVVVRIIALRQQELQRLDDLVKARFVELFGDPVRNSMGLKTMPLGKACCLKAGITTSADMIHEQSNEFSIPCYGGNGIRGYVELATQCGCYPIIGRQGALCGNVQLATGKFHATEHAVLVTPLIETNVIWLFYLLKMMDLYRFHTGAAQPGLAVKTLNTVDIPIADVAAQHQFAAFVTQTDKSKVAIQKALDEAQLLFDSLMQKYFG